MKPILSAASLALIGSMAPACAQGDVTYLGEFDTVGNNISVTPLDDTRLEYCWESTSGKSGCSTFVYTLENGKALFAGFDYGRFEMDLVTNVLTLHRYDGIEKVADMTPVAR